MDLHENVKVVLKLRPTHLPYFYQKNLMLLHNYFSVSYAEMRGEKKKKKKRKRVVIEFMTKKVIRGWQHLQKVQNRTGCQQLQKVQKCIE